MRYKLTPLAGRLDDPAWHRSEIHGTIYVGARTEREARETAARKLAARQPATGKPAGKLAGGGTRNESGAGKDGGTRNESGAGSGDTVPGRNPWLDPRLTDCVDVNDIAGDSMLLGEIIAAA